MSRVLSFFVLQSHEGFGHPPRPGVPAKRATFDITDAVRRLSGMGKLDGELKVTFMKPATTFKARKPATGAPRPPLAVPPSLR